MPKYNYIAKTSPDKTIREEIEAESEQDALNKINSMGIFPISVTAVMPLKPDKIPAKDITVFTRQLSNSIESGINIFRALNVLVAQTSNKTLKLILADVSNKIKSGRPLSGALADYPQVFPSLYTSLVHSGEASGNIGGALQRLADFMEADQEFKNSVRAALTYPVFIIFVGFLSLGVLFGFVVPRLVLLFNEMGQALPLPTKILIAISKAVTSYWWVTFILAGLAIFLWQRIKNTQQGRTALDNFKLKLFAVGDITLKIEIGRFMRTLSLLLSGGTPIVPALGVAASVLENSVLEKEIRQIIPKIAAGSSFSACLKNSKILPVFLENIIAIAEETGTLEKALLRIADSYEADADRALKQFTRLLEPVIILVMGLIVGFIVLSLLLPIFRLNLIIK